MTSTFLSASSSMVRLRIFETRRAGRTPGPWPAASGLFLLRAIARRDAFLFRVFRRRLLDHGTHDRLVRFDPVGDGIPLPAVPLQELHRASALVIHARDLER